MYLKNNELISEARKDASISQQLFIKKEKPLHL